VIAALRTLTAADVAAYPEYDDITTRVAVWLGVDRRSVLLTNGPDEGLYAVAQCSARASDGQRAAPGFIQVDPTFEMFEEFTRIVGATLIRVTSGPDFAFPMDQVLDAIDRDTRVVYLVDPNNPTGQLLPDAAVERIAAAGPDALVFVDEAYADFSGRTTIGAALERHPNIVVGRTFAKGHGLAGLRVGALVAHPPTIDRIRRMVPPFGVNVAAIRALDAALSDDSYLRWSIAQSVESRTLIAAFCDRHGLRTWPSAGNFVLVRVGPSAPDLTRLLAARGIDVRDKSTAPGCAGCLRLTAGVVTHTERLLAAMEETLATRTN
jgi:histidinol-phosphate aminotransferase